MPTLAEAEANARSIVNGWTAAAAGVGWMPGSMILLGAADVAMIRGVADAFHVPKAEAEQIFGSIAASMAGKTIATELLSLIPGPGWAIKAGVAASITKTVGETFIKTMKARSHLR